jgi:hypothetical protein
LKCREAEHYSNLYDDAYVPHMQRITWSGRSETVPTMEEVPPQFS